MSTYWVQGVHTSVCRRAPKPLHFPRGDSPHSTRSPCNLSHRPPVSVIWVNECIAYTSFGPHPDSYEQRRTIHRTQSGHVDRCLYTSSSVLPFTSDLQTNSLTLPCFHFPRLWNGVIIPSLEEYAEGQMRCCLHWALKDIRVVCLEDYGSVGIVQIPLTAHPWHLFVVGLKEEGKAEQRTELWERWGV